MRLFIIFFTIFFSILFHSQAQTKEDYAEGTRHDLSKAVQVFPNPAFDFVHVKVEHLLMENIKISLHNIIGNELAIEREAVGEHEIRVRVKDLATGYYLLALKDDEDKFRGTYKFLKR